ncbi:MAG TPA: hypothetical protein VNU64_22015 [Burkholderiales bacterium]|nr:hypothetical protein [Burkholderiales bacterium]
MTSAILSSAMPTTCRAASVPARVTYTRNTFTSGGVMSRRKQSLVTNTRQRLLNVALKRLGLDEVAKRLGARPQDIDEGVSGRTHTMPGTTVLALVDLVDQLGALGDDA